MRTRDVCRTTGATYRQVDYWRRRGLIPGQRPPGSGNAREQPWTIEQVHRVRMILFAAESAESILQSVGLSSSMGGGKRSKWDRR